MAPYSINYIEMASYFEKSLNMFGIKDAFLFFRISKKRFIFNIEHSVGNKDEWNITKNGKIIMPKLGIY